MAKEKAIFDRIKHIKKLLKSNSTAKIEKSFLPLQNFGFNHKDDLKLLLNKKEIDQREHLKDIVENFPAVQEQKDIIDGTTYQQHNRKRTLEFSLQA